MSGQKLNIIDRVIAGIAPQTGANRALARWRMDAIHTLGGYDMGRRRKRGGKSYVSSASGNAAALSDLQALREATRDLVRNNPLASGLFKTKADAVVGVGLMPRAMMDRDVLVARTGLRDEEIDQLETEVDSYFELWASGKSADYSAKGNHYDQQRLVYSSHMDGGDVFVLLQESKRVDRILDLTFQVVEADRVCNPNSIADWSDLNTNTLLGGIEHNKKSGAPTHAHVMNRHPGDLRGKSAATWKRVTFETPTGEPLVFHVMRQQRAEMARGVPLLAPSLDHFEKLKGYVGAELRAAEVSALFTAFIKSGDGKLALPPSDSSNGASKDEVKLGAGAIVGLGRDEEVTFANPSRPNPNLDAFVISILREIGADTGVPVELVIKQFKASYSASRGALLEFWRHVVVERAFLVSHYCGPARDAVIFELVARGLVDLPGFWSDRMVRAAYLGSEWDGPAMPNLDPNKEVDAAIKRVNANFSTSNRESVMLTGMSHNRIVRRRAREQRFEENAGVSAVSPTDEPVIGQKKKDDDDED